MEAIKKIIYVTIRDIIFCLCLLFLCFNPYADLSDKWRVIIIFTAFVFYLLIPRLLNYSSIEEDIDILNLHKISEQKENFVATLSHDLKTPALSQITSLQILLSESFGVLNNEQKNIISATLNSCKYMKEMIFTILATYKFKNGAVDLNYEEFDIEKLIFECIEETKSLMLQKGIKVKVFIEGSNNNIICADKIHIKRVIMNLIANAISYAFKNTTVKINIVNDRGYLRFYIENMGEYIEDEILKQLFKRYSSFASKYKKVSVGLGLYLSRKIIEAHNGVIKAESFIEDNSYCLAGNNKINSLINNSSNSSNTGSKTNATNSSINKLKEDSKLKNSTGNNNNSNNSNNNSSNSNNNSIQQSEYIIKAKNVFSFYIPSAPVEVKKKRLKWFSF